MKEELVFAKKHGLALLQIRLYVQFGTISVSQRIPGTVVTTDPNKNTDLSRKLNHLVTGWVSDDAFSPVVFYILCQ